MAKHALKCLLQKDTLRAAYESRLDTIYKTLQKAEHGFGMEDIHVFRVEIKKLKAFLRLLRTGNKHSTKLKISKRLQKIYKVLGQIRILQLQEEYMRKEINEEGILSSLKYMDKLSKKVHSFTLKAGELVKRKKPIEKERQSIRKNSPDKLLLTTLESFLDKKIYVIIKLLSQEVPDEKSMHLIRKHLKDVLYNSTLIKTAGTGKKGSGFPREEEIQSVARLLGNYHDLRIALGLLDVELNENHIPGDEKNWLRHTRNKWQIEKENTGKQAYQACRSLLQPGSGEFD